MVVAQPSRDTVLGWLAYVADPEIPVVSVVDLGIVRDVRIEAEESSTESATITVSLTPTYSGCPATEVIEASVRSELEQRGVAKVRIERVLSPPWTTDWISADGRRKLLEYGIAPPAEGGSKRELLFGERMINCPRCNSSATELVSEFGSTACKAAYKCSQCLEPFEYFKCI